MFLTLNIDRDESCLYTARVLDGHVEVTDFQANSVASAIRETAQEGFGAIAFHIWYGGISIGTTPVFHMLNEPGVLADRLMSLHGSIRG